MKLLITLLWVASIFSIKTEKRRKSNSRMSKKVLFETEEEKEKNKYLNHIQNVLI